MKKYIRRLFAKIEQLLGFDKQNQSILKNDHNYQVIKEKIVTNYNRYLELLPLIGQTSLSDTETKANARAELEKNTLQISDLLLSYGALYNFLPFKNLQGFNKSNINAYADFILLEQINHLQKTIDDYPTETLAAGVKTTRQKALQKTYDDFNSLLRIPREVRLQLKHINEELQELYTETQHLLQNALYLYMRGNYAEDNPTLFRDFEASIQLNADSKQARAVLGVMVNKHSGEALQKVKVSVDGKKPIRKGSKSGHFYIQKLQAGTHTIRFELEGFHPYEIEILHIKNKTIRLVVEMESLIDRKVMEEK